MKKLEEEEKKNEEKVIVLDIQKGNIYEMRVYTPEKSVSILQDVLRELYLLKQAVEHQAQSVESRLKMIDKIRIKIQEVIDLEESESK